MALSLRLHDVSESHRAEAALRHNRDELEQRIAERTIDLEVAVANLREEVETRSRAERKLRKSDERHRAIHGWGDPGDYVCLSVRDRGCGMNDETRARVFEPFFTTKQPGEGTGLGMAMVYGLVKQHRGFADVESTPGQGTTVRIYFPAGEELAMEVGLDGLEGALPRGTEKILLVEDDVGIRRAAERALDLYGYKVIVAGDGAEGLRLFEESAGEIALVISDVVMPKMNGHDLYKAIRERSPATKCILMSGYADRGRLQAGEIGAAIPMIAKPWALGELLRQVRDALDGGGS